MRQFRFDLTYFKFNLNVSNSIDDPNTDIKFDGVCKKKKFDVDELNAYTIKKCHQIRTMNIFWYIYVTIKTHFKSKKFITFKSYINS